jgi:hypothetical protein
VVNPYNLNRFHGNNGLNYPQSFNITVLYELPFFQHSGNEFEKLVLGGWRLNDISTFRSRRLDHAGIIRGPGSEVWNLSLFKEFHFWENNMLEFRAESFNLFNHTNPNNPNATYGQLKLRESYWRRRSPHPGARSALQILTSDRSNHWRHPSRRVAPYSLCGVSRALPSGWSTMSGIQYRPSP